MKILLLGPRRPEMAAFLGSFGDELVRVEGRLTSDSSVLDGADLLVSYGYRHIIKPSVLASLSRPPVNLHISLLPWNRGADPNLWSFLEDTPKGVTIHVIDEGVDTGPILAQREIEPEPGDTLRSAYGRLSRGIEKLFRETWPAIRSGEAQATPQVGGGTAHRVSDRARVAHLLTRGWDTPVAELIGKALPMRARS